MLTKYRPDIDGLRALAVMAVVAYHFKNTIGFNGYMGVDIFFVISGYLITKIIVQDTRAHGFSLSRFYERRIRRIIPALLVVILASTALAYFSFLPAELLPTAKSAITALLFSSNIQFYLESGYFDASAELKPLLHTWSLAVEEQFYILYPLLLAALIKVSQRRLKSILIALFIASLATNFISTDRDFNFYMFPMRAWELLAGAFIALHMIPKTQSKIALNILPAVGCIGIAAGFLLPVDTHIPYALHLMPVVLGTALIIYAGEATNNP